MDPQAGDGQDAQSLSDIQSYLVNFNKEISAGGQTYILAQAENAVQGQSSFVVTHPGEQLYEEGTLLQSVTEEGMTVPKTEEIGEQGEAKLKIESGLQHVQATQQLDQSLLAEDGDGNMFNPINIAPAGAQSTTEPLFTVQGAGGDATGLVTSGQAAQLITVQPHQAAPAVHPQLVALQANQAQPPVMMTTGQQLVNSQAQTTVMMSPGQQLTSAQTPVLMSAGQQLVTAQTQASHSVMMSPGQQLIAVQQEEHPGQQLIAIQQEESQAEEDVEEDAEEEEEEEEESSLDQSTETANYQTVTIVPSEVNQGGEVSYVLIVSQNDQEQKPTADGNIDMSVYDFKEEARGAVEEDESTKKGVRSTPKKQPAQMTTQLMCNYCNYTSPKRYLLTRHMKTHSEERPHKCHICDRGFKTVASLQNHINTHTGVRPHKCKECDAAFTTSGELVRHVRYRHTFEKPHKCPECDYASVELSKLKRHMRSHTGERPYQCPHCSYASPDTYKLKRHLRIHTGEKPYECDICHTRFTQSNSLKAHKLIHTGNKPIYQCELCPTTCGRKTDLKIHVQKLHTSDKPLQCKKCGKSFPDRYTWKIHVKTHEGEKCFKCELCPYAALSQRHLESHLLTHTGEKPFECDECEQTFRQKQLLRRHKNLYHTPDYVAPPPKEKIHECTECAKAFAHKGNLLRHRAGHDPENQEYQTELDNYRREQGEDYNEEDEEEEEEEEEEDDGNAEQVIVTQAVIGDGQTYTPEATGQIHMANINGQQVQLQLVNLNDENNTQVYIQIDNSQQLQGMIGQQVAALQTEEGIEEEEEEELQEEHHLEEELPHVMEADTPPTGRTIRQVLSTRLDVKQEEMKYENTESPVQRSRVRSGHLSPGELEVMHQGEQVYIEETEHVIVGGKHKLDLIETPTKRPRRDSPRRQKVEEDEEDEETKRDEQKKKDIETCFGFGEL